MYTLTSSWAVTLYQPLGSGWLAQTGAVSLSFFSVFLLCVPALDLNPRRSGLIIYPLFVWKALKPYE